MASKRAGCRSLEGLSEGRSDHRAEMRGARWRLNHILTRKRKRNKRKKKDESS